MNLSSVKNYSALGVDLICNIRIQLHRETFTTEIERMLSIYLWYIFRVSTNDWNNDLCPKPLKFRYQKLKRYHRSSLTEATIPCFSFYAEIPTYLTLSLLKIINSEVSFEISCYFWNLAIFENSSTVFTHFLTNGNANEKFQTEEETK